MVTLTNKALWCSHNVPRDSLWHAISQKKTATRSSFRPASIAGKAEPAGRLSFWPDAEWTIVGSSPLAKTYHSRKEFIDAVIEPFNARMSKPLVPTVRGIYADGANTAALRVALAMQAFRIYFGAAAGTVSISLPV
jgi:ketosteroid isomerase-like protein